MQRKKMRKILGVACVAVLALALLAGCGSDDGGSADSEDTGSSSTELQAEPAEEQKDVASEDTQDLTEEEKGGAANGAETDPEIGSLEGTADTPEGGGASQSEEGGAQEQDGLSQTESASPSDGGDAAQ